MLENAPASSAFAGAKVALSLETTKLSPHFFHFHILFNTDGAL